MMFPRFSLTLLLTGLWSSLAAADFALPGPAKTGGYVVKVDLNRDGHEDIVVSNADGYGVYLFVPESKAKKNLEWHAGWTQVMREGKPHEEGALPSTKDAQVGKDGLEFGGRRWTFEELLRVPGPAPKSAADSQAAMQLVEGFSITLVAQEPQLADPVFIDWDERGRMWVVEMGDYPFADGEKTNDGQVTSTDGAPAEGAGKGYQEGRVRVLEDADGDGLYEKSQIFLQGLKHPTGLACWKGGVFLSAIPDVIYAKDVDGDGRCDIKETWFSGFKSGNPQHLVNGFCWGLDGWLHAANGDSGGDLQCHKSGQQVALGTNDFRFHPVTGQLRLETGRTQCGKWRDDFGNWFGNNNANWGWHYWLPMAWMERHPDVPVRSIRSDLNMDRAVFPAGPPQRRLNQSSSVNTLTSGCNAMPYRDTVFGALGERALFTCEPANNLVHVSHLQYDGPTLTTQLPEPVKQREFLASRDPWFRPVMARTGPDGALYVVDMYRLVLEHPEWIPAEMAKRMVLRGGETMGRIWRIAPSGHDLPRATFPIGATASAMASSNGWVRDTAQRLIVEQEKVDDRAALAALASNGNAAVRVQALFTLDALGLLKTGELHAKLKQEWPSVRSAALVAAGSVDLAPLEKALVEQQAANNKGPQTKVTLPVITNQNPDRQKVVQRYLAAANLKGDSQRGKAVFVQAGCVACHLLGGEGAELGPDLGTVAAKPTGQLIEAIFDPNRAVEQRHATTQIQLKDGTIHLGLLVTETPGSVILRQAGGAEQILKRADIAEVKTLSTSLMPAGLEALITEQDCADLLSAIAGK